jgi:hypothetical protein
MRSYILFRRTRTDEDPRRRWRKYRSVEASSRPDALRRATPGRLNGDPITRYDHSIVTIYGDLVLAWRADRIDFDHYDFNGNLVTINA